MCVRIGMRSKTFNLPALFDATAEMTYSPLLGFSPRNDSYLRLSSRLRPRTFVLLSGSRHPLILRSFFVSHECRAHTFCVFEVNFKICHRPSRRAKSLILAATTLSKLFFYKLRAGLREKHVDSRLEKGQLSLSSKIRCWQRWTPLVNRDVMVNVERFRDGSVNIHGVFRLCVACDSHRKAAHSTTVALIRDNCCRPSHLRCPYS